MLDYEMTDSVRPEYYIIHIFQDADIYTENLK